MASADGHQTLNLTVSKAEGRPGDTLGYTVSYASFSDRTIEEVVLTLDYDESYLTVTEANGATPSAGVLVFRQPQLVRSRPESRTFWFKIRDDLPVGIASIKAYARLAGKEIANVASEVVTTVVVAQARLHVMLSADQTTARPGDLLTFTVSFRNDGDAASEDTTLTFDFDEGVTDVISVSDNTAVGNGRVVWNLGTLFPAQKSSRTVSLRVRENAAVKQFDTFAKITAANASSAEQHILIPLLGVNSTASGASGSIDDESESEGIVKGAATERAPRTGGAVVPLTLAISALTGLGAFLLHKRRLA